MNRTTLVTGVGGFVGSHFVRTLLDRTDHIADLDRRASGKPLLGQRSRHRRRELDRNLVRLELGYRLTVGDCVPNLLEPFRDYCFGN